MDEAGRGPVIGPMVVAGVAVESDAKLRQLRVRDSKKLSFNTREQLAPQISKVARTKIIIVPPEDIDALRAHDSLNVIEARIFASVIDELSPTTAYVDCADIDEARFKKLVLVHLRRRVKIISKHRADDVFPVVSAASIIAKVTRDVEVRKIEKELGMPVGSGYPSDPVTREFLKNWVREHGDVPPHSRRSWETSQHLLSDIKSTRIDRYLEEPK